MVWALVLPFALIGALGNRLRGGLWGSVIGWGSGVARLGAWGIPCGVGAWACGAPWWAALAVIVGAWAGCTVPQFGALSMGHRGGTSGALAWGAMTLWGLARMGSVVLVAWWLGGAWWWPLAAGLLCAPLYELAWHVPLPVRGLGYPDDPPEMAEALHGAAMGAGLFLAFFPPF